MSASPSSSNFPTAAAAASSPVFAPAFAFDDDENVDEQLEFGLSLESPPAYVFSNDLAFEAESHDHADVAGLNDYDDGKAASMRSVPTQRDSSAFGFEPLITPRSFEGFVETNIFESSGKAPVFVLDKALPSPLNGNNGAGKCFDFFIPTSTKVPASPLSPAAFASKLEIPEKERSDFYSVNPAFTSYETPDKIMDVVKSALSTLHCECETATSSQWTLDVSCLLVAEQISFAINLYQIRGASTKYEVEFVRRSGDELVFADLTEHIRSLCGDVDDEASLSLFSKTLDAWMDDKQELVGRRFAIQETEAASLVDELNCEFLHMDALHHVARSIKNHCRHKGNRRLFVQNDGQHKNFVKGLKWMLADNDELVRYALFVLLQFAGDEELCSTFFTTPIEKSNISLVLENLHARETKAVGSCSRFTTAMVDAVRQSALFA